MKFAEFVALGPRLLLGMMRFLGEAEVDKYAQIKRLQEQPEYGVHLKNLVTVFLFFFFF